MSNRITAIEVKQLLTGLDDDGKLLITETILSDEVTSDCIVSTFEGLVVINQTKKPKITGEGETFNIVFTFVTTPIKFQKSYRLESIEDIYEVFGWIWTANKKEA